MLYYSIGNPKHKVSFKEALFNGISPDRSLYFPYNTNELDKKFIQDLENISLNDIAYSCIRQFVGKDIEEQSLRNILDETINFEFPLKKIEEKIFVLELFHGPTMAFKDVGARFTSRCISYFIERENLSKITVLVATSGDTGAAVASGFHGVDGIDVFILYPSGKISGVQEKQISTYSDNIFPIEVEGTFDDCQRMVKDALIDKELTENFSFTSANSINISRWIPQMLYYFFAYRQIKNQTEDVNFSVPSGNYGNLFSALMSKKLGLPINRIISANNSNNPVERYLKSGKYNPISSIRTLSSAMDVGDPSNFIRVKEIFELKNNRIVDYLSASSFSDDETKKAIINLNENFDYTCDPHGAIGYLGAKKIINDFPDSYCVFLETAHPAKFLDEMNNFISFEIEIPDKIKKIIMKDGNSHKISSYDEFKDYLNFSIK